MNSEEFKNLYLMQSSDESITPFTNEVGFSLIRKYPEGTAYFKNGRLMFIKVAVLDRGFFFGVDMTKPEKRGETTDYIITDGEEYRRNVTNFFSDGSEFMFDNKSQRVVHQPTNKIFTMNEFVEVLASNHLSDRLFFKRKLNALANMILKFLFWLSDKHYDKVRVSIDKYDFNRNNKPLIEEEKNSEPFFKYFYISKNILFAILLFVFLLAIISAIFPKLIPLVRFWPFGDFSLSNPFMILFFFLILFSCEKFSVWLNAKIKDFFKEDKFERKNNFIERLHNYQYQNKFKLKLK